MGQNDARCGGRCSGAVGFVVRRTRIQGNEGPRVYLGWEPDPSNPYRHLAAAYKPTGLSARVARYDGHAAM